MIARAFRGGLVLAVVVLAAGAARAGEGWRAGVARTRITPEGPMWMSGYAARDKPADGTIHDLWVKALALDDGAGHRAVLVTLDLVGIPRELALAVRGDIAKAHGLPPAGVVLACSHTHSGPVVGTNLGAMYFLDAAHQKRVADYTESLRKKIVATAGAAVADLKPAGLSWGRGYVTFGTNRRNNKEAEAAELRAKGRLQGPVDHDVPVLAVRDPEGKLRAVVLGYACHATVLSGYQWCGDYPGFAQAALEQAHPGAVALFWAGCGGDQNPLPRRSVALAEQYGRELARGVDAVLDAPLSPIQGQLKVAGREAPLPFAELPTRERLLEEARSDNRYMAARARLLLEELQKNGSLRGSYPYPVVAWRLGDGPTLVALGGEVVVDYALRLKRELGREQTWVMAYANDVMAYIPSVRVLKEGGYEGGGAMVYYGLPTVWSPQVEEIIVAAVRDLAGQVRANGAGGAGGPAGAAPAGPPPR